MREGEEACTLVFRECVRRVGSWTNPDVCSERGPVNIFFGESG